jgi:hypothetical protein
MEADQGLLFAQRHLCRCVLSVKHFEQGEAALAISILDCFNGAPRIRKSRAPKHLDFSQRA